MRKSPEMKYICRCDKRRSWHVQIKFASKSITASAGKMSVQKNFQDGMFGGKEYSLIVAKLYRDATAKRLQARLTRFQRSKDGVAGTHNGMAKITEAEVLQMREMRKNGKTLQAIFDYRKEQGMPRLCLRAICGIVTGEKWKHLPGALPKRKRAPNRVA